MAAADARAGRRSERARRQRAGLDCFLHSTPDNTTASLSYAYILISFGGSSDESSREIIASCKPRNKICGARGNNKGPPPAHRGWPEMNISYSHGKGLTRVDSSVVPS